MGRYKENPKYNVVSLRISLKEREKLEELSQATNRKISDLMREALRQFHPAEQGA
ncbi:ribbon-helix-helix protein, CopG family [Geobacter sp. SVR]|uniref:ribbon-helix-helix protein, CopG family n=1 Tax=Geobacter sp. SVR TaxID=2495594 RepID=UPI00143F03B0|nr:ribbon-helix-helix protein, CopG family [Geobacter sp. SVR]BCS55888.1 hydrogenase expression protein HypE [Geobacter sp. SVR]GCF83892.1 hydrogenase expression protein HypE [Geobacter sp. SVR]